jgi:hypothetical protein
MRAAELLQRLPHPVAHTGAEPRRRRARRPLVSTISTHPDHTHANPAVPALDLRVREAGGPMDNASYSCACGMVFAAAVSTTVSCPHCGADQAW